jgi:LytS/YehU family sensor histidine kinase
MSRMFGETGLAVSATMMIGMLIGGLLTHAWRGVILRNGLIALPFGRMLPRLAAGVAVTALSAEMLVWGVGLFVTHAYTLRGSSPGIMFATTSNWLITVTLWTTLYVASQWFARWRRSEIDRLRLEVLARDAQLEALHAQIQPHFLFNAMNVLRALIAENPARARELVTELSDLMRYALQVGRRERVALDEELAVVESYLRVESARFEERLQWRIEADAAVRATRLPPMLVQTLVENAVKHGVAAREEGGEVTVIARLADGRVTVRVTNPGCLRTQGDTRIGLANARGRLQLLYGELAALELAEHDGHVIAEVRLPAEDPV